MVALLGLGVDTIPKETTLFIDVHFCWDRTIISAQTYKVLTAQSLQNGILFEYHAECIAVIVGFLKISAAAANLHCSGDDRKAKAGS